MEPITPDPAPDPAADASPPQSAHEFEEVCRPSERLFSESTKPLEIKLIGVGWSENGRYYGRDVLVKRAGLWKTGTKMYLEHEDPSIRNLAGQTISDSFYTDRGWDGPGIYAEARVFDDMKSFLKERQLVAGTSIKAMGTSEMGEAEGRKGEIVTDLTLGKTCDFVSEPAAAGKYRFTESTRRSAPMPDPDKTIELTERNAKLANDVVELTESNKKLKGENTTLRNENTRLKAAAIIAEAVGGSDLPDPAKERVTNTLLEAIPAEFTADSFKERAKKEVEGMKSFIESVTPKPAASPVHGLGSTTPQEGDTDLFEAYKESYLAEGMDEASATKMAKIAARAE